VSEVLHFPCLHFNPAGINGVWLDLRFKLQLLHDILDMGESQVAVDIV
jgi:hypothetical protein